MKKNKIILFSIISCLIILVLVTMTSAKYAYNSVWNYYLHSRGFYFKSDMLSVSNQKNSILQWDGKDIAFSLSNSENGGLVSEYDIAYKISCEVLGDEKEFLECVLNDSETSTVEGILSSEANCVDNKDFTDVRNLKKSDCELSGYTWVNEISKKDNYFNIILKDETKNIDELSVQIIAETTSPYKKVLKGIFHLNLVENEMDYEIDYQNYAEYNELAIINKSDKDKCFTIEFDSKKYIVNETSSIILSESSNNDKIDKIKIKVEKNKSSIINFYKINIESDNFIEDLQIKENDC